MKNEALEKIKKHIESSRIFLTDLAEFNKNNEISILVKANLKDLDIIESFINEACESKPDSDTSGGLHLADVNHRVCANCTYLKINAYKKGEHFCPLNNLEIKDKNNYKCNRHETKFEWIKRHGG